MVTSLIGWIQIHLEKLQNHFFLATWQYRGTNQLPLRRKGFSSDINSGGGRVEAATWALRRAEHGTKGAFLDSQPASARLWSNTGNCDSPWNDRSPSSVTPSHRRFFLQRIFQNDFYRPPESKFDNRSVLTNQLPDNSYPA